MDVAGALNHNRPDWFAGAFSIFRNPSAHQEVKFEDPRHDTACVAKSAAADGRQKSLNHHHPACWPSPTDRSRTKLGRMVGR